ncbi:uncharacterized protein LOC123401491 [Hordeum vulgare subsp. vulgare]|uniref:uncharacterized protein LOC123401491 n=1 Tax=Hordeum vulgare subsp. vulgare TaxID=112509 RepID=UPI001D1A4472|nr:uncharacterized protein LOC123401491 [Hordeum vulgare subsp. vulgare]
MFYRTVHRSSSLLVELPSRPSRPRSASPPTLHLRHAPPLVTFPGPPQGPGCRRSSISPDSAASTRKSVGNESTPTRSARIQPGPAVVATGEPPRLTYNASVTCPCTHLHEDDARGARMGRAPAGPSEMDPPGSNRATPSSLRGAAPFYIQCRHCLSLQGNDRSSPRS